MAKWFVTDTHFGHRAMTTLCGRPPDFGDLILESWKTRVQRDDTVYHLGDILFRVNPKLIHDEIISRLPGRKVLIRGNHDNKSDDWYRAHWWDTVDNSIMTRIGDRGILLRHKPLPDEDMASSHITYVCGHLHTKPYMGRHPNVVVLSLEKHGYKVFSEKELEKIIVEEIESNTARLGEANPLPTTAAPAFPHPMFRVTNIGPPVDWQRTTMGTVTTTTTTTTPTWTPNIVVGDGDVRIYNVWEDPNA